MGEYPVGLLRPPIRELFILPVERGQMNNERRRELDQAIDMIANAQEIVERVAEEEQEAFDNLPESFQQSEKGEEMSQVVSDLESIVDSLVGIQSEIDDAKGS